MSKKALQSVWVPVMRCTIALYMAAVSAGFAAKLEAQATPQTAGVPVSSQQVPSQPVPSSQMPSQQGLSSQLPVDASGTGRTFEPPLMQPLPLIVASGDLLDVQVFNTPELSGRIRVDQFGSLNLPVGGPIHVAGMTAAEASSAIEEHLKSGRIMRDPHVTIFVTEYTTQMVTVLGEVKKSGPVPLYGAQTLYDVLGAAGGVSSLAGDTITISHRNDSSPPQVINVHTPNYDAVEHNTQIRPGDTVVVSQADFVYVLGSVNRQGSVPMPNGVPLSLLNILSLSSGLNQLAAGDKAAIIRKNSDGVVTTINIDIGRVIKQQVPDPIMQASDILVVPSSTRKYLQQLLLPTLASTAISGAVTAVILR